jgi:hypothetical protein
VQVGFGGFHAKLSGLKSHGLFFDTHLELIFSQWRDSEGMINWVKYPGDPNQIEDELTLVVSAIYTCAIRGRVKQRAAYVSDSGDSMKISATHVVDFIIERASQEVPTDHVHSLAAPNCRNHATDGRSGDQGGCGGVSDSTSVSEYLLQYDTRG